VKLLAEAFPECNTLPKSYNEAKNLLNELGLGYDSIHVCCLGSNIPNLMIAPFVVCQDGKIQKERRFRA
jgi:hypothetical protein